MGAFYLELPLAAVFHDSNRIGPNIVSSDRNIIFFTPGVRWKLWVHSRVSFYAALGGGLASFGASVSTVGPGISNFPAGPPARQWTSAAESISGSRAC